MRQKNWAWERRMYGSKCQDRILEGKEQGIWGMGLSPLKSRIDSHCCCQSLVGPFFSTQFHGFVGFLCPYSAFNGCLQLWANMNLFSIYVGPCNIEIFLMWCLDSVLNSISPLTLENLMSCCLILFQLTVNS